MTLPEAVLSVAVALAAGALIGAERQQAQSEAKQRDFGGIRTFPLVALAGACAGLLQSAVGVWAFVALFAGIAVLLAISYAQSAGEHLGISSEVAALVSFALGAIAASPQLLPDGPRYLLVAAIAASTMSLLALKRPLHGFIDRVSEDDVYATAKFVLLALVVIPVLPNRTYGWLDVINPLKIGLFTAIVAGISFAGYVAIRLFGGQRGMILTGVLGGLASSTAVTLTFSGRVKGNERFEKLAAIAIVAASSTMFLRMLVIVGVRDHALLPRLALSLGAMAVAGYAGATFLYRREATDPGGSEPVPFRNPFELRHALAFGLVYALVLVVVKAAQVYIGSIGLYLSAVIAGLADVDAITLSLAELHRGGTAPEVAARGIALAAISNTLVKMTMAWLIGGWSLGRRVGGVLLVAVAIGGMLLAIF
jgi:uncharacterized membrane protein (DUF4010 family)